MTTPDFEINVALLGKGSVLNALSDSKLEAAALAHSTQVDFKKAWINLLSNRCLRRL